MIVAIISDIHSNKQALDSVLQAIRVADARQIICAGDIVGYGAAPNECCSSMMARANSVVMGNHDMSALTKDTDFMNPYAARAVLWTAANLNSPSRQWLLSLKSGERIVADDLTISMYHGSVESNTEYVYEEDVKESMLLRTRSDCLVLGHTHIPFVKRFDSGLVINPGSVGQPRDRDWRASFALLDSETKVCRIARVDYDIDAAAEAIDSAGLPSFLADRLYSGT